MDKTAQKRNIIDRAREKMDIGGVAAEKFNPEVKKVMDNIREVDDAVRSIVAGVQQGKAAAPKDARSLKKILENAKTSFKRLEYLAAVSDIMKFSKKIDEVSNILDNINADMTEAQQKFLFEGVDPETIKYITEQFKEAKFNRNMVKEAGVINWMADSIRMYTSDRGKALRYWQKMFPKKTAQLKKEIDKMIKLGEALVSSILLSLKSMNSFRINRDPEDYILAAAKMKDKITKYLTTFAQFKKDPVESFVTKYMNQNPTKQQEEQVAAKEETATEAPTPSSTAPIGIGQSIYNAGKAIAPAVQQLGGVVSDFTKEMAGKGKPLPVASVAPVATPVEPNTSKPPQIGAPYLPEIGEGNLTDEEQEAANQPEVGGKYINSNTRKFIKSLEVLSNESPLILKNYILKYAKTIESTDPMTSIKLKNIVSKIVT